MCTCLKYGNSFLFACTFSSFGLWNPLELRALGNKLWSPLQHLSTADGFRWFNFLITALGELACMKSSESTNHKNVYAGRDLWSSSDETCWKRPQARLISALPSQALNISNEEDSTHSVGNRFRYLIVLTVKHIFYIMVEFLLKPPVLNCLLSCHCSSLSRKYLHLLGNYYSLTSVERLWLDMS